MSHWIELGSVFLVGTLFGLFSYRLGFERGLKTGFERGTKCAGTFSRRKKIESGQYYGNPRL